MEYTSRAYGLLNRTTKLHIKEVQKFLDLQEEDKVLEIGCAKGQLVKAMQSIVPEVYGIDVNAASIENGVARNLEVMSAEDLKFQDQTFDKIYSFHTIEHVPSPEKMLKEIARVLKPGGKALLVYPAEPVRGLFSIVASLIMFGHPFNARKIHLHKFTPKKVQALLSGTALEHVESGFSFLKGPEFFTVLRKQV